MYNLNTSARMLEKTTSAASAALAAVSPATAGHLLWIFEQESPPVWELFCEVDLGKVCKIGLRPHNLFSACDLKTLSRGLTLSQTRFLLDLGVAQFTQTFASRSYGIFDSQNRRSVFGCFVYGVPQA